MSKKLIKEFQDKSEEFRNELDKTIDAYDRGYNLGSAHALEWAVKRIKEKKGG